MFSLILIKPARERNAWQEQGPKEERRVFSGFKTYEDAYKRLNDLDIGGHYLLRHGWIFWRIEETKLVTRNIWSNQRRKEGETLTFGGKEWRVVSVRDNSTPPNVMGLKYELTITELPTERKSNA